MPTANAGAVNTSTNTGVTEFVFAKLTTQQTGNVSAGDHIKFDTIVASRGGSVVLDITTAYNNANAVASVGRVTLKAGKTYLLRATIGYALFSGATGLLDVTFYDATAAAVISGSGTGRTIASTAATHDSGNGVIEAVFTPTQDSLVEVRFAIATVLTQLGSTGQALPTLFIETL